MTRPIDDLFRGADVNSTYPLRPYAWRRIEEELDLKIKGKHNRNVLRYVAAAVVFILALVWSTMYSSTNYKLEELAMENDPLFSKEEIAEFYSYYPAGEITVLKG